jgi:hypothetical protein
MTKPEGDSPRSEAKIGEVAKEAAARQIASACICKGDYHHPTCPQLPEPAAPSLGDAFNSFFRGR